MTLHPKSLLPAFAAALLAAGASPSQATTLGLYGGEFVTTWDNFSANVVDGEAADTASADYSAVLNLNAPNTIRAGGGERIYGFGNSINFTITSPSFQTSLPSLSLVLKFTPPGPGSTSETFFSVSLGSGPVVPAVFAGTSVEGSNNFSIYRYDLGPVTAGSALDIRVTSPGDHVSLDAVQLVPEPTTSLLAGVVGAGLMLRRRRK